MLIFQYSEPPFSEQESTGTFFIPDIDTSIVLQWQYILPDIVYDIVYDIILDDIKLMMLLVQDCVCVVAPYPFKIKPLKDFDPIGDLNVTGGGDLWYARPLLYLYRVSNWSYGRYNLTQGCFPGLLQHL
jgi:hypothetical protein